LKGERWVRKGGEGGREHGNLLKAMKRVSWIFNLRLKFKSDKGDWIMKTQNFLWVGIGTVLVFTLIIILGYGKESNAAEKCTIVNIRSHAGVEPEVLKITKGDCVVWINWTRGEDVKVIFKEGKKCADITKAPVGFKLDSSGCYVTDFLAFGQTSSLMFPVAGSLDYEVEFQRKVGKAVKGSIQVK
jgi:hypothetical protein